ncbi:hypothetical protein GGI43DRAFT_411542 [Trichoderma evansii]
MQWTFSTPMTILVRFFLPLSLLIHDPNEPRDLAGPFLTVGNLNSPRYCADVCGAAGYQFAGVEFTM